MILQELCKLYDRLKADPEYHIPLPGYSLQKISFILVLNSDGTLFAIKDARVQSGKKQVSREIFVPGQAKPSGSGLNPCILWDNPMYLLGVYTPKNPGKLSADDKKKIARAPLAFEKSREVHLSLKEKIQCPQFQAVAKFFEQWNPADISEQFRETLREVAQSGFGVFQILGEPRFVHEIPEVSTALDSLLQENESPGDYSEGMCLISGEFGKIAELHKPAIKGVVGAQGAGAMLVSFNWDAATSYGKENGENAPVSTAAANSYCEVLNALIRSPKHRFLLGDATVVFWTGEKTVVEDILSWIASPPQKKDSELSTQDLDKLQKIDGFLKNLRDAGSPETALAESGIPDSVNTPFFMLGLSPNAARLSIRFWYAGTLGCLLTNLRAHHRAMQIQRSRAEDSEFIPIWQILRQTARDADGIPPLLGGALLRAVIENLPYPQSLIQLVLNRTRIESRVSYTRASILKAFLTRNKNYEITMSLDKTNTNQAYLLGRLFATLEKAQSEAIPGANSGIRERFYASASATPRTVFPILLRTFPHHVAKLPTGRATFFNKLSQEIIDGLNAQAGFPAHLNMEAQGFFAIGYYHQTQAFFTKKTDTENPE